MTAPVLPSSPAVRRPLPLAAGGTALFAVLALAGCGSVSGSAAGGGPAASASAGPCGAAAVWPTGGAEPHPGWSMDGVRILAANEVCAEYEVTNRGTEPMDVSVLFRRSGAGEFPSDDPTATVRAVPAGGTATGRFTVGGGGVGAQRKGADRPPMVPDVRVLRVRSVPTAEAPAPDGPCPASGMRVFTDRPDAAMGLRAVGLHLVNCGTAAVELNGRPEVEVLDGAHRRVDSVRVLAGGAEIATGTGADVPQRRFTLRSGQGAVAVLVWRNTTGLESEPVNAPYARVRAVPGAAPVMVTPELDLGTTGRLGVGAWAPEPAGPNGAPGTPGTPAR
ncbi:DUF4232 domain-containing protein [Kitasatospora sp. NPDC088391]|uniref:DUF4232 domain-containing protein n=1 Tax=Kitasatospora sp. NPDC088391 TaxID=3364074 RepID=UPI0037FF04C0